MKNLFTKFVKEEQGGIAEYVIILGIVAMIGIILGPKLKNFFSNYSDCMNNSAKKALNDQTGAVGNNC